MTGVNRSLSRTGFAAHAGIASRHDNRRGKPCLYRGFSIAGIERDRAGRMAACMARSLAHAPERTCALCNDPGESMSLLVLGINHQTAPVSLRERVAFDAQALPRALASLGALPQVHEVALLSTCNRTELYAFSDDDGRALADWLATHPDDASDLHAYLYTHHDAD